MTDRGVRSAVAAFLEARLAEDERAARRAVSFRYDHPGDAPWERARLTIEKFGEIASADPHLARHSPTRVLREVAAKRAILKRHARTSRGYCDGCGYQDCDEPLVEDAEQCPELLDMASVWSDHPDYRTEWSVT